MQDADPETAGMQVGSGQVTSYRAEDVVGRHSHQGPEEMQD